jgi:hypothetical protein
MNTTASGGHDKYILRDFITVSIKYASHSVGILKLCALLLHIVLCMIERATYGTENEHVVAGTIASSTVSDRDQHC